MPGSRRCGRQAQATRCTLWCYEYPGGMSRSHLTNAVATFAPGTTARRRAVKRRLSRRRRTMLHCCSSRGVMRGRRSRDIITRASGRYLTKRNIASRDAWQWIAGARSVGNGRCSFRGSRRRSRQRQDIVGNAAEVCARCCSQNQRRSSDIRHECARRYRVLFGMVTVAWRRVEPGRQARRWHVRRRGMDNEAAGGNRFGIASETAFAVYMVRHRAICRRGTNAEVARMAE